MYNVQEHNGLKLEPAAVKHCGKSVKNFVRNMTHLLLLNSKVLR